MTRRPRSSRKRSAASSTAKRPSPRAVFYLDESIYSLRLAAALEAAHVILRRPGSDVPRGTPDAVWLKTAGEQDWIVLLRDKRVRHRASERAALLEAGVAAFVFTGGQVTAAETAELFSRLVPKILNIATSERRPFLYTITVGGSLVRQRLR